MSQGKLLTKQCGRGEMQRTVLWWMIEIASEQKGHKVSSELGPIKVVKRALL